MTLAKRRAELTNWSKSASSPCLLYQARDIAEIGEALAAIRNQHLSVIPHGAGHSYTDAAFNTRGAVIDVTPMRRILAWDAGRGIMRVEAGVTMRAIVQKAWEDGWWPFTTPSTAEVTIGGCTAMNVNGKNAWKYGPFGAHVLSLDVLLASGEMCTLEPERDPQLFHAFVGSMGLLGILTSITVQLQRIPSGYVTLRKRSAASLAEIFSLFAEEEGRSDYMEAWLDGFASGAQLGRGFLTCASLSDSGNGPASPMQTPGRLDRLESTLVSLAGGLGRPFFLPGVQMVNRAVYGWGRWNKDRPGKPLALPPYTYWPPVVFAGYRTLLPEGTETLQAFVRGQHAHEIFERALLYSQEQGCMPIWCVIKQHRRDPFLLSYQVDGFSLELNYRRTRQASQRLQQVLQHMINMVIEAGGKFYLAKDHYLTQAQYRQSMGDEAVDSFLNLKQRYDPEGLLQSDLYRRVFQPPAH